MNCDFFEPLPKILLKGQSAVVLMLLETDPSGGFSGIRAGRSRRISGRPSKNKADCCSRNAPRSL